MAEAPRKKLRWRSLPGDGRKLRELARATRLAGMRRELLAVAKRYDRRGDRFDRRADR